MSLAMSETGMFKQTIYFPLQRFAKHAWGTALDAFVESGTCDTSPAFPLGLGEQTATSKDVPLLDVSAAHQPDSKARNDFGSES